MFIFKIVINSPCFGDKLAGDEKKRESFWMKKVMGLHLNRPNCESRVA